MDIVDRDLNTHLAQIEADESYQAELYAFEADLLSSLPDELAQVIAEQLAENESYLEVLTKLFKENG